MIQLHGCGKNSEKNENAADPGHWRRKSACKGIPEGGGCATLWDLKRLAQGAGPRGGCREEWVRHCLGGKGVMYGKMPQDDEENLWITGFYLQTL